jgi:hypothetical protein
LFAGRNVKRRFCKAKDEARQRGENPLEYQSACFAILTPWQPQRESLRYEP